LRVLAVNVTRSDETRSGCLGGLKAWCSRYSPCGADSSDAVREFLIKAQHPHRERGDAEIGEPEIGRDDGGDAREAVKALLIANEFLEAELETQVSHGYMCGVKHGRFNTYFG
jgi:hypothetical protein